MRTTALLAAASLALLLTAADEPAAPGKDPQASYEPRSAPGAGQAFLAKLAGDWDIAKTFYPRTGDPVRSSGTCRQTMTHGGRFLRSEFTFRQGEAVSTGTGLIGFEPATGRFTSVWVDSRQTRMSLRQGRGPFDGKTIVLSSASLEPEGPDARRSQTETVLEAEGRRVVHRQFALSADGSRRLMMELVMTRKADAPAPPAGR